MEHENKQEMHMLDDLRGAKFGDLYRTRNGLKAIFVCWSKEHHIYPFTFIAEGRWYTYDVTPDGRTDDGWDGDYDIVGKWEDEQELTNN